MRIRLPITPAAALALAIIVASETAFLAVTEPLTGLPLFQPTVDDATIVAKREIMERAAGQLFFVGDSSCLMDLDSDSFPRFNLGRPVNLGSMVSFTLPGYATLAEQAIARRPRAIVVAVLPRSFEVSQEDARRFNLLGRYLVAYGEESPAYALGFADRWSWFVRKHRFNLYPPEWGGSFKGYVAELSATNGHYIERGTYRGPQPGEYRDTFKPTEYSRRGFLQLVEVARQHDLPVVLWWSPSPRDGVSATYLDQASRFVEDLRHDAPTLQIARPAPAWDPTRFGSITHLTPQAATINSDELAAYLSNVLPVANLGTNVRATAK